MYRMGYVLLLFLTIRFNVVAQEIDLETNKFNESGEKHGYWKTFVNQNFKEVDSSQAKFFYYYYYHNGKRVIGIWKGEGLNPRKEKMSVNNAESTSDSLILFDGTYITHGINDKNHFYKFTFEKGFLVSLYVQFDNSGHNWEKFNFKRKYGGITASYYTELQSREGVIKKGYCYYLPDSKKMKYDLKKSRLQD